jgi:hypothetical protein
MTYFRRHFLPTRTKGKGAESAHRESSDVMPFQNLFGDNESAEYVFFFFFFFLVLPSPTYLFTVGVEGFCDLI